MICSQRLVGQRCLNTLCNSTDRMFDRSHAIAMKTGALEEAILRWKDHDRWAWGIIFARVLVGYLLENFAADPHDCIIPSPTFAEPGAAPQQDMTRFVIQQAIGHDHSGKLPFHLDPPLVIRMYATPKMRRQRNAAGRQVAAAALRAALRVPDPALVAGRRILVYDDVFTSGNTLNEVARALRNAGAAKVSQVALSRQPWSAPAGDPAGATDTAGAPDLFT
ncbi:ComF family protein [Frankia sp. R43]|uniref:ComF family protein n=1 Tax=Frankia sp. R43 TaxID=269536 RepID=UPI0006CA5CCF|nr:phosphoribosyltransferase family protein [Frankia sp. R43]